MPKLKSTKTPNPNAKKHVLPPIRVNDRELAQIKKLAKLFTGGVVSEWIRYAATNFKVTKNDLGVE